MCPWRQSLRRCDGTSGRLLNKGRSGTISISVRDAVGKTGLQALAPVRSAQRDWMFAYVFSRRWALQPRRRTPDDQAWPERFIEEIRRREKVVRMVPIEGRPTDLLVLSVRRRMRMGIRDSLGQRAGGSWTWRRTSNGQSFSRRRSRLPKIGMSLLL